MFCGAFDVDVNVNCATKVSEEGFSCFSDHMSTTRVALVGGLVSAESGFNYLQGVMEVRGVWCGIRYVRQPPLMMLSLHFAPFYLLIRE